MRDKKDKPEEPRPGPCPQGGPHDLVQVKGGGRYCRLCNRLIG